MSTISVDVDIDDVIEQIDDEDLVREVEERGLKVGTNYLSKSDQQEELEAIYHLMRLKKSKEAYKRMYNYIRDVLGKAV
jgi:hypothetical protein